MRILGEVLKLSMVLIIIISLPYLVRKLLEYIIGQIKNKRWKALGLNILVILIVIISIKSLSLNYEKNRLPSQLYCGKECIMNLNEVKQSPSGTKIKLGKVLLDLNHIDFNIGVKGRDKIVATEIKKSLEDKEVLRDFKGLWLGERFSYIYNGFGASFKSNNFIDPIYIICYLSNGEEVNFKVEDKKNIKEKTEIINVDQVLDYKGKKIRVKTLIRGINYTNLSVVSDLDFLDAKFYIIQDGKTSEDSGGSGTGGMTYFSFKPIKDKDITIKCVIKSSGKEFLIKVR